MDESSIAILISLGAFFFQIVGIIVAGVWVVAKIQTATEKLSVTIEHLAEAIDAQRKWLGTLDKKVDNHGERLAVVEVVTEKTLASVRDVKKEVKQEPDKPGQS